MKKQSGKKLVEILAVELKEWPDDCKIITQSFLGKEIYGGRRAGAARNICKGVDLSCRHSEEGYPEVTREMWEAERAKLSKPKASAQAWIRHRGRKNPFDVCTLVDARLRSGGVVTGKFSENLPWLHTGSNFDVMAYRVNESVEAAEPEVATEIDPVVVRHVEAFNAFAEVTEPNDGPLQWRDRITEIDREVEALEEERESLIQKLADEGLQLLRDFAIKAMEPAGQHDMSDWCNWQIGDFLEVVKKECGHKFPIGEIVRMKSLPSVTGGQIKWAIRNIVCKS